MTIIFLLIAASTIVALIFLTAFTWAVKTGQFDDDRSPAVRILGDHLPPVRAAVKPTPAKPVSAPNTEKNPNA